MSRRRSVLQEPPFVQQLIRSWIPTTLRCLGWLALMVSLTGALALALFAYLLPLSILAQLLLWAGVVLGACLALMLFALEELLVVVQRLYLHDLETWHKEEPPM